MLSPNNHHGLEMKDLKDFERKSRQECISSDYDEKDDSFGSESGSMTSSLSTSSSESESENKVNENSNEWMKEVNKHNPMSASSSQGMPFDLDEASGTNAIGNQIELRFKGMFSSGDGFVEDLILRAWSYDYTPTHDIEDFNELENVEEGVMSETCQGMKQRRRRHHMYCDDKAPFVLEIGE